MKKEKPSRAIINYIIPTVLAVLGLILILYKATQSNNLSNSTVSKVVNKEIKNNNQRRLPPYYILTPSKLISLDTPLIIKIEGKYNNKCQRESAINVSIKNLNSNKSVYTILYSIDNRTLVYCNKYVVSPKKEIREFIYWNSKFCGNVSWGILIGYTFNVTRFNNITRNLLNYPLEEINGKYQLDKTYLINMRFVQKPSYLLISTPTGCFPGIMVKRFFIIKSKNSNTTILFMHNITSSNITLTCKSKPSYLRGIVFIGYSNIFEQKYLCNCTNKTNNSLPLSLQLNYCILSKLSYIKSAPS